MEIVGWVTGLVRAQEQRAVYLDGVKVTLEIPDEFAAELIPMGVDPARRALGSETRFEVDPFLLKHEICDFTIEDFRADMETQRRILG